MNNHAESISTAVPDDPRRTLIRSNYTKIHCARRVARRQKYINWKGPRLAFPRKGANRTRRLQPCLGISWDAVRSLNQHWPTVCCSAESRSRAGSLDRCGTTHPFVAAPTAAGAARPRQSWWQHARVLRLRATGAHGATDEPRDADGARWTTFILSLTFTLPSFTQVRADGPHCPLLFTLSKPC